MDKRLTEVGLTSYPDHMGWPGYETKVGLTSYPDHMEWSGYETKVGLTSYPDHMGWPGYEAKMGRDVQFSSVGMLVGCFMHKSRNERRGLWRLVVDCGS